MAGSNLSRREFVGLATATVASKVLGISTPINDIGASGAKTMEGWDQTRPFQVPGVRLKIQPVLMYGVAQRKEATSWKSWGGIQTDDAASDEAQRISTELKSLAENADFPLLVLPIAKVKSVDEASKVHGNDYDVIVVYAATGSGQMLRACFSRDKSRNTIVFVRHCSGPAYYWYEALSVEYLKTDRDEAKGRDSLNQAPMSFIGIHDVVVDDYQELLWRLRALYGLKNFVGAKIIALGGAWGKYSPEAPAVAREKYKIDIVEVSYDEITQRIRAAKADSSLVSRAEKDAEKYLSLPNTTLLTEKKFVVNAFVLYHVFKELMHQYGSPALTIRNCMTTILPIAQTTPCLTLSIVNDEGWLAFCESDFVVIPAGILLRYVSGKPVFLHNSTFPHKAIVTCAHCSSPRRMDGVHHEPAKVLTHYESEYGAAPKVEMPKGQEVTFINPEYSSGRWVGFKGTIRTNPSYEICRSQQDVEIQGDWKRLLNEVRDSHWVMCYGDYLKEVGYASSKIGIAWENISQT